MARIARGGGKDREALASAWTWYRMRWVGWPIDRSWRSGWSWVTYTDTYAELDRTVPDPEDRIAKLREVLLTEMPTSPQDVDAWVTKNRTTAAEWDVRRGWGRGEMPPTYDERIARPLRAA
jgi:hypothetical protein